jgi:hypothetical protein
MVRIIVNCKLGKTKYSGVTLVHEVNERNYKNQDSIPSDSHTNSDVKNEYTIERNARGNLKMTPKLTL